MFPQSGQWLGVTTSYLVTRPTLLLLPIVDVDEKFAEDFGDDVVGDEAAEHGAGAVEKLCGVGEVFSALGEEAALESL